MEHVLAGLIPDKCFLYIDDTLVIGGTPGELVSCSDQTQGGGAKIESQEVLTRL